MMPVSATSGPIRKTVSHQSSETPVFWAFSGSNSFIRKTFDLRIDCVMMGARVGRTPMKRVAIYLGVGTSRQDTNNQRRELETVAERSGWQGGNVHENGDLGGVRGRDQRPRLARDMECGK